MDTIVAAAMRGEAARAAAAGDRRMALAWLEPLQPAADAASALLRARIFSQLGEFDRAIESWQAALAVEPGNVDAQRGLAAAERLRGSAFGRLRLHARGWGVALAGVIVVLGVAWAIVQNRRGSDEQLTRVVEQFERERAADSQAAAERLERALRQVRDAAQTREAELRELLAQERLRRVEVQGQMRRLTRRVGEMAAAINALNQVRPANGKPVQ